VFFYNTVVIDLDCRVVYNILLFVYIIAIRCYIKLLNNIVIGGIVPRCVIFLSAIIVTELRTKLLLILKTIALIKVVKLHSIMVVLIYFSRRY
jgi:hypothetical protein